MWVKSLLLAGALAIGAATLPGTGAEVRAQTIQPNWINPAQGRPMREQNILSAREVIEIVRSRFGGEPLGSPSLQSGARPFYILRWRFPNELVEVVRVDAVTGQVSR